MFYLLSLLCLESHPGYHVTFTVSVSVSYNYGSFIDFPYFFLFMTSIVSQLILNANLANTSKNNL